MDVSTFPAEPWNLTGNAVVSVGLTRAREVAAPPGTQVISIAGRAITACAFFTYTPPSPLSYDEVMAATLVREGWRPRVHITHIWVDSPASRAGGRALWAIPKELADFDVTPRRRVARGIATTITGPGTRLALRLPTRFVVAQARDGRALTTPVAGSVRVAPTRARWAFDLDGPLRGLAGFRPILSVAVRAFRLRFGPARRG